MYLREEFVAVCYEGCISGMQIFRGGLHQIHQGNDSERGKKKNRKINFCSKRENFHFSDSNLFSSVGKPPKGIGNLLETQC